MLKVISNQDKEIILNQRDEIKNNLINQNKKYYYEVFNTKVYQDKVCEELLKNDTRNRILRGNLRWDKHNQKDVFDFLKLLEMTNQIDSIKYHSIEIEE